MNDSEATEFVKRDGNISQFKVYSADDKTSDNRYLFVDLKHF